MNDISPRIRECSNYAYLDSILFVLFNFGPFCFKFNLQFTIENLPNIIL
jgi:hypothetical protein